MKQNYQLETDKIISSMEQSVRPALLLHSCCGPCSSYVLEYLTQFFDISVLFFGPNIQPQQEYEKRLLSQKMVLKTMGIKLMECEYEGERFDAIAKPLSSEPEGGERCTLCFALRIEEAAKRAKEHGFDFFCTTLSVSPHKDAGRINKIGKEMAEKYAVKWLYSDFKKKGGYARSVELAEQMELYRQDYCGCVYSLAEAKRREAAKKEQ